MPFFKAHQSAIQGTWQYRSALSQQYPTKPYHVTDDVESFVHCFHYMVLKFSVTNMGSHVNQFVKETYDTQRVRKSDRARIGGEQKLRQMTKERPTIVAMENPTLNRVLRRLAKILNTHYSSVHPPDFERLYGKPAEGPSSPTNREIESALATGRDARQTHDSLYAKTPLNDHASVRAIFAKAASKKVDWTGDHRTVNQFSRYGRAQLSAPPAP